MTPDTIEQFIDQCIHGGPATTAESQAAGDEVFNRLALDTFAYQYEAVPIYRRLCDLRRARPGSVDHWSRVPAAPADLFKEDWGTTLAKPTATFLSSGTSQGAERRSRHAVDQRGFDLYRRSSLAHFEAVGLPDHPGPMHIVVLGPTAATHPMSSLGHMYSFFIESLAAYDEHGGAVVENALGAEGDLDLNKAIASLEEAAATTRPVLILALSSTLTALFEALRTRGLSLRLPADSRIVDTGGAKGGRTFSRAGLLKAAWRFLHIPAYLCIGEYGMTELLSQFYDDAFYSRWSGGLTPRAKVGPAWTRTMVVDPVSLTAVEPGERGLLKHFDLANFASICAVQTLDLGVKKGNGFEVLGRASGAETRGCSQLMSMVTTDGAS